MDYARLTIFQAEIPQRWNAPLAYEKPPCTLIHVHGLNSISLPDFPSAQCLQSNVNQLQHRHPRRDGKALLVEHQCPTTFFQQALHFFPTGANLTKFNDGTAEVLRPPYGLPPHISAYYVVNDNAAYLGLTIFLHALLD